MDTENFLFCTSFRHVPRSNTECGAEERLRLLAPCRTSAFLHVSVRLRVPPSRRGGGPSHILSWFPLILHVFSGIRNAGNNSPSQEQIYIFSALQGIITSPPKTTYLGRSPRPAWLDRGRGLLSPPPPIFLASGRLSPPPRALLTISLWCAEPKEMFWGCGEPKKWAFYSFCLIFDFPSKSFYLYFYRWCDINKGR